MVGTGTVVFGTSEGTLPTGWNAGGVSSDGVIVNASSRTVRSDSWGGRDTIRR